MKVSAGSNGKVNSPSFAGYSISKSDKGKILYDFNLPYDHNKYNAYLEVFSVEKDENGNYKVKTYIRNRETDDEMLPLKKGGVSLSLKAAYGLGDREPFAYRYTLVEKENPNNKKRITEAGALIEYGSDDKFNLVLQNGTKMSKGGAMELILPDSYNPGFVYEKNGEVTIDESIQQKARKSNKSMTNKLGGTLAGIEEKIPELKKFGYSRIVTTPLFTDDSVSSHSYWIKNAMQMSQSLGNASNYASFQRKMFAAGMNLVADGAFVNEGLEGVHFKDVLKKGEKSPYYDWFRAEGLKNGPLSLGIFSKNRAFIRAKVVNSPDLYIQKEDGSVKIKENANPDYDSKKPTYIQLFDDRLVQKKLKDGTLSEKEVNDNKNLIKFYEKTNTDNLLEINTHDDSIVNYAFPIDAEIYRDNVQKLSEYNETHPDKKVKFDSPTAARMLTKLGNFEVEEKFEGGFDTWDANTDIAKLRFVNSYADMKALKNLSPSEREERIQQMQQKNFEVQDYAIQSGKYWTKKTNDIHMEYSAQQLNKAGSNSAEIIATISKLVNEGALPKTALENIDEKTVKNAVNGKYASNKNNKPSDLNELILSSLMDLPLDSIEFGDDITAVMGYPSISNRATSEETLGKSRYELYKDNNPQLLPEQEAVYSKTQSMYTNELMSFAGGLIDAINSKLPQDKKFEAVSGEASNYAKFILPLVGQDITKFAVIKALYPNAKVSVNKETGEIVYDYNQLKGLSLKDVKVDGLNSEDEADALVSKIKCGINKISDEDKKILVSSITKRIEKTDLDGFRLSEMIIDKTHAGLDWRIDAAKDIADIGSIRNKDEAFAPIWDNVTSFWKNFTSGVLKENRNSYLAAEITDVGDLHGISGRVGTYGDGNDAERKFLNEAGITTTANYSYFFSSVANMFSKDFVGGYVEGDFNSRSSMMYDKMKDSFNTAQLPGLIYSYTFIGNHDKPRALHCLALDMGLFHGKSDKQKQITVSVLHGKLLNEVANDGNGYGINFEEVSPKAVAMGYAVKNALFDGINEKIHDGNRKTELCSAMSDSIAELASGRYLGKKFSADAFGTKPLDQTIDMVLNQMEKMHGINFGGSEKRQIYGVAFERLIKPAMTKLEGMMSFLVSLPGNPTLFSGDDLGLTGYDEKCKNVYLQNRQCLHWEWLEDSDKQFVSDFYNKVNNIMALRNQKELQPMNTGTPYLLKLQSSNGSNIPVPAVLRQDSNGAMTISVFNPTGINVEENKDSYPEKLSISSISLSSNAVDGLKGGLTAGETFLDFADKDKLMSEKPFYVVCEEGGSYFIKKFANEENYDKCLKTRDYDKYAMPIEVTGRNLILYNAAEKKSVASSNPSFNGRKVLYNPQYNFVSSPYQKRELPKLGSKIQLVSK